MSERLEDVTDEQIVAKFRPNGENTYTLFLGHQAAWRYGVVELCDRAYSAFKHLGYHPRQVTSTRRVSEDGMGVMYRFDVVVRDA